MDDLSLLINFPSTQLCFFFFLTAVAPMERLNLLSTLVWLRYIHILVVSVCCLAVLLFYFFLIFFCYLYESLIYLRFNYITAM